MSTDDQDEMTSRMSTLAEEFPGYQFSWSEDDGTAGNDRFRISVRETEDWSTGEVQSASGDSIEAAISRIREQMRNAAR